MRIGEKQAKKLKQLYVDSPAAFSSVSRLRKIAQKEGIRTTEKELLKLMQKWTTFSKFQNKYKKPNKRDRVIVAGPHQLFHIDLCILPKYRNFIGILIW